MSIRILTKFQPRYSFTVGNVAATDLEPMVRFPAGGKSEDFHVVFRMPGSRSWVAAFDGGNIEGMFSGLVTWPDPSMACVVAAGSAWLIDVEGESGVSLETIPIASAIQVESHRLVLFVGLTRIEAWDAYGKRWCSRELSWDGIDITGIRGGDVVGRGFDLPPEGDAVEFSVDLLTGESKGGVDVAFEAL